MRDSYRASLFRRRQLLCGVCARHTMLCGPDRARPSFLLSPHAHSLLPTGTHTCVLPFAQRTLASSFSGKPASQQLITLMRLPRPHRRVERKHHHACHSFSPSLEIVYLPRSALAPLPPGVQCQKKVYGRTAQRSYSIRPASSDFVLPFLLSARNRAQ